MRTAKRRTGARGSTVAAPLKKSKPQGKAARVKALSGNAALIRRVSNKRIEEHYSAMQEREAELKGLEAAIKVLTS